MAMGNRFISRSNLLWAFYECGCFTPPVIWKEFNNSQDEDRPPYHIYWTATKLAESSEKKSMLVEHFVFATLSAQVTDLDEKVDVDVGEKQRSFQKFMQDLDTFVCYLSSIGDDPTYDSGADKC